MATPLPELVEPSAGSFLNTPLLELSGDIITPSTLLLAVLVLLLGGFIDRTLRRRLLNLLNGREALQPERAETIVQLTRIAIACGTGLTAMRALGLSLETLDFVWGLFNRPLLVNAGTEISVVTLLTLVVVVVVGFWLSDLLQKAVKTWAKRNRGLDEGSIATAQRLLHYVIVGLSVIIAMQTIGINLDALLAAGAVFAVGFGLAMQSIAQNFVSGIILLLEQSIRPGDVVEVSGKLVRVEEMAVRSTIVVGLDGDRQIVPNSMLVQSTVRNLTMRKKNVRVHARVGVAYHIDPDTAVTVLLGAAESVSDQVPDLRPVVQFASFGESSLDFDVFVWISDPWAIPEVRSQLNTRIWQALKRHNIPIPFPQRDLHLIPRNEATPSEVVPL